MEVTKIKNNPDLEKKLKSIYSSINSLLKDDAGHNKLSYGENEVGIMLDVQALNERIMFNRMKKIHSLTSLVEHWDEFRTLYQNDTILKRIGVEFLEDKFFFDKDVIKTIQSYPKKSQILYYFQKNQELDIPNLEDNAYTKFRDKILPSIKKDSELHKEQKNSLLKAIDTIGKDKSQKNLNYLISLSEGNTDSGKISVEWHNIVFTIKQNIAEGNFFAKEDGNELIVELPIPGVKKEVGINVASKTSLLRINLENPKQYSIEVGELPRNHMSSEKNLEAINEKSIGKKFK